jgi:uncharacterized protein (TIGR02646 family)
VDEAPEGSTVRKAVRPPDAPEDLLTKGAAEQDKAETAYLVYLAEVDAAARRTPPGKKPTKPSVTFKMYKDPAVKKILVDLFDGKCAYCESFYSSTQPMDVEHYRPKGAVDGEEDHLGYYWLAATWENLLPSCIDCNRQRSQFDEFEQETLQLGKKDRFPVAGQRARKRGEDLEREAALLVDPTVDDPTRIFRFDYDLGIILPRFKSGKKHDRATNSIEVYGLNRAGLVADRRHIIRQFDHHLRVIGLLSEVRDGLEDEGLDHLRYIVGEVIDLELDALFSLADPDRPYSAMAAQFINDLAAHVERPEPPPAR